MKILLVTLEYPPIVGGISTYLHALYSNLTEHEVTVISPATHTFYSWWCYPRWLPFYFELKKIVARDRPDQIHVSHVLPIGIMARWIYRSLGVPYVLYFHGADLCTAQMQPRKWPRVLRCVAEARHIMVNSQATQRLFTELCGTAYTTHIVRPGAPSPVAPPSAVIDRLKNEHALGSTRIILFLARLIPRKGLFVALEAIRELQKNNVEATLVVAGTGPERTRAEQYAREQGIASRVRFIGRVTDQEKWMWFSAAHVFWFPAIPLAHDFEGFGITSLEAQAQGCPVVVSNLDGLCESMQPDVTGLCVEPTAAAFATATEHILSHADRWQHMRSAAREFAALNSWEASQQQLRRVLQTDV